MRVLKKMLCDAMESLSRNKGRSEFTVVSESKARIFSQISAGNWPTARRVLVWDLRC